MHETFKATQRSLLGAALVAALAFSAPALAAPSNYTMTFLGSFGGKTLARSINNQGNVVGWAKLSSGDQYAIWSDGSTTTRSLGGAAGSDAYDINNNGQIVAVTPYDAVIFDLNTNTVVKDFGAANVSGTNPFVPTAINDSGQVTGTMPVDSLRHAFFYDGTTVHDLGTLAPQPPFVHTTSSSSFGYAINSLGHVVGATQYDLSCCSLHAFLYDGTAMHDLGVPPSLVATAIGGVAVNDSDQVVVRGDVDGAIRTRTFRYDAGTWTDLGSLVPNAPLVGEAINNTGHIVGYAYTGVPLGVDQKHGFLHDGTALYDLNNLIDPADPYKASYRVTDATAINDNDEIAVSACFVFDATQCYAFLLKPETTTASAP